MGVWLPIALADLKTTILAPWVKREDLERLKLGATLRGWCLPMMASAIEADEKEQEALALFNSIQHLAEKQKAKEAAKQ